MIVSNIKNIYFMGIGGTGMSSVAGLCYSKGFNISGSDKALYPPTSLLLEELKIPVYIPYDKNNLVKVNPDLIVVGNALSRGNPEVEYMLEKKLNYCSFPQLLGEMFLKKSLSIVVAGTHGKTTTSSLIAHILDVLEEQPGFFIGGVPKNFTKNYAVGSGKWFVVEGDEYDTAFFDKEAKFLHYFPHFLVLNNVEFDHADIYKNVEQIENQFIKLINIVPDKTRIIANIADNRIVQILRKLDLYDKVYKVSNIMGLTSDADVRVVYSRITHIDNIPYWINKIKTKNLGEIKFQSNVLVGEHNLSNVIQVLGFLDKALMDGFISAHKLNASRVIKALESFKGVKRRLDMLLSINGIEIYEDFAHHPTAVLKVIQSFKTMYPNKRLIIAFEPANATGRRNILMKDFAQSLKSADKVLIGECPVDLRIPEDQRMNTKTLAQLIGDTAISFNSNQELLKYLLDDLRSQDVVIFMTSSSFSGIQYQCIQALSNSYKK